MNFFKGTKYFEKYWQSRKADWKVSYLDSWTHPHRKVIVEILKTIPWLSLLEIGCNAGPNLLAIVKNIPNRQVGGIDINPEAIELAKKTFQNAYLKVNAADDIMMSDKSVDVVLSDMMYIYVDQHQIGKYIKEIKRIARNYIVLCEFHSTKWWNRLALKINSGYNAYNWRKLLSKHGFYDTMEYKLTEEDWPGGDPQKTFGYIFISKVPRK